MSNQTSTSSHTVTDSSSSQDRSTVAGQMALGWNENVAAVMAERHKLLQGDKKAKENSNEDAIPRIEYLDQSSLRDESAKEFERYGADVDQYVMYYCSHCGESALFTDVPLDRLKTRKTDKSYIIIPEQSHTKLLMEEGQTKTIRRDNCTVEKQWRYICRGCGLYLAYTCQSFPASSQATSTSDTSSQTNNSGGITVVQDSFILHDAVSIQPGGVALREKQQREAEEKAKLRLQQRRDEIRGKK